jgi:hypothetical protein
MAPLSTVIDQEQAAVKQKNKIFCLLSPYNPSVCFLLLFLPSRSAMFIADYVPQWTILQRINNPLQFHVLAVCYHFIQYWHVLCRMTYRSYQIADPNKIKGLHHDI